MSLTPTALQRVIMEDRARNFLKRPIKLVPHAGFATATAQEDALWRGPMPEANVYEATRQKSKAPSGTHPRLVDHFLWPLLNREQEQHLFRKLNYLKYLTAGARDEVAAGNLDLLDGAMILQEEADLVREHLFNANQRIVVKIAHKFTPRLGIDFWDVMADGDISLLHAVELFDFSFGFKFSTYAYWSILKNYSRAIPEHVRARKTTFCSISDVFFEDDSGPQEPLDRREEEEHAGQTVVRLLSYLEPKERAIVRFRCGIGTDRPLTLEQVGRLLGFTKERARQIEVVARAKMQAVAANIGLAVVA